MQYRIKYIYLKYIFFLQIMTTKTEKDIQKQSQQIGEVILHDGAQFCGWFPWSYANCKCGADTFGPFTGKSLCHQPHSVGKKPRRANRLAFNQIFLSGRPDTAPLQERTKVQCNDRYRRDNHHFCYGFWRLSGRWRQDGNHPEVVTLRDNDDRRCGCWGIYHFQRFVIDQTYGERSWEGLQRGALEAR